MKKYFIFALCAILSIGLITGCGSKKDKKDDNKENDINENQNTNDDLYDYSFVENDYTYPWYKHYPYDENGDLIFGVHYPISNDNNDSSSFLGTIFNGKVSVGDTVDYLGYKGIEKIVIQKIYIMPNNVDKYIYSKEDLDEIDLKEVNEAKAKEKVVLVTSYIDRKNLELGDIIAKEDSISLHKEVEVKLEWISKDYGVKPYGTYSNYSAIFTFGEGWAIDHIEIPDGTTTINPGDSLTTKIVFKYDVPCDIGWEFTIRGGSQSAGKAIITNVY